MRNDVDERLLEHVLHVVLIGDVSRTNACQLLSIEGVELPHRLVFTVAKPLSQALFVNFQLSILNYKLPSVAHILSDKEDGSSRLFADDIEERACGVEIDMLGFGNR